MNYIENTKAAIALIESLPNESVDLSDWRRGSEIDIEHPCGSVACMGGWIAIAPYFKKLGVTASIDGAPRIHLENRRTLVSGEVSERLFGRAASWLFSGRYCFEDDLGTDREVAIHRLKEHLKDLEKNE